MGQDSGIRKKEKRRTVEHKKHAVFPGIRLSPAVRVEHGSIRQIKPAGAIKDAPAPRQPVLDSEWTAYDEAARKLSSLAGSSALSMRREVERKYNLAYRRLVRSGKIWKLKAKYTLR